MNDHRSGHREMKKTLNPLADCGVMLPIEQMGMYHLLLAHSLISYAYLETVQPS